VNWLAAIVIAIGMFFVEGRSEAHHSFAMFDFTKTLTFRATVKEFQWTNPHVILTFDVEANDGGAPQTWWAELTSPGNLTRVGWSKRAFKAGDHVEIDIHPLRDGTHGGAFTKATLVDTGQVWTSDLRAQEKPELGLAPLDGGSWDAALVSTLPEGKRSGCSFSPARAPGDGSFDALAVAFAACVALRRRRREPSRP
jgi:MYXO-CTERM domain-containing protein